MRTKANMQEHPEEFGSLFQRIDADDTLPKFGHAVIRFGQNKVFEVMETSMKPINDFCKKSNLFPILIVASCEESTVDAIHHLLCRDLSWVDSSINSLKGNAPKNKKIRLT